MLARVAPAARVLAVAGRDAVEALHPIRAARLAGAGDEEADTVHGRDRAGGDEAGGARDAAGSARVRGGQGRDDGAEVCYAGVGRGVHPASPAPPAVRAARGLRYARALLAPCI